MRAERGDGAPPACLSPQVEPGRPSAACSAAGSTLSPSPGPASASDCRSADAPTRDQRRASAVSAAARATLKTRPLSSAPAHRPRPSLRFPLCEPLPFRPHPCPPVTRAPGGSAAGTPRQVRVCGFPGLGLSPAFPATPPPTLPWPLLFPTPQPWGTPHPRWPSSGRSQPASDFKEPNFRPRSRQDCRPRPPSASQGPRHRHQRPRTSAELESGAAPRGPAPRIRAPRSLSHCARASRLLRVTKTQWPLGDFLSPAFILQEAAPWRPTRRGEASSQQRGQ